MNIIFCIILGIIAWYYFTKYKDLKKEYIKLRDLTIRSPPCIYDHHDQIHKHYPEHQYIHPKIVNKREYIHDPEQGDEQEYIHDPEQDNEQEYINGNEQNGNEQNGNEQNGNEKNGDTNEQENDDTNEQENDDQISYAPERNEYEQFII